MLSHTFAVTQGHRAQVGAFGFKVLPQLTVPLTCPWVHPTSTRLLCFSLCHGLLLYRFPCMSSDRNKTASLEHPS